MVLKNDVWIDSNIIIRNLKRITNQIYKLLPYREEGVDWQSPLDTVIIELSGMSSLFMSNQEIFFSLLCKLNGLKILTKKEDFLLYRRTIFECLNKISELINECQN